MDNLKVQENKEVKNTYFNPTPGAFPIMGIGLRYGYSYYDVDTLALFSECGINLVESRMNGVTPTPEYYYPELDKYPGNNDKNIAISLDNCAAMAMYLMVRRNNFPAAPNDSDEAWTKWRNDWRNTLNFFKSYWAVGGWMLADEPESKYFANLGETAAMIQQEDPKHSTYINLLPSYAFRSSIEFSFYMAMATQNLNLQILSTDFYPFEINESNVVFLRIDYFDYLISYNSLAKTNGIPFWATIRTTVHNSSENAILSQNCIQYQVACALAFGCQGLAIWRMTGDNILDMGRNSYAPISYRKKNNPTESWDTDQVLTTQYEIVKNTFSKVRRLSELFLDAKVENIECVNSTVRQEFLALGRLPEGQSAIYSAYELKPNGDVSDEKAPILITTFSQNGQTFYMVLNLKWDIYQSFQLEFKSPVREIDTSKDFSFKNGLAYKGTAFRTFKGTFSAAEWRIYQKM